jgi:hypothetical protein
MSWTALDLVTEVRAILQDKAETRYTDERILRSLGMVYAEVRRVRPDYFVNGLRAALPVLPTWSTEGQLTQPTLVIFLPEQIRALVTMYVAGFVELADTQYTEDKRAVGLMSSLGQALGRPVMPT